MLFQHLLALLLEMPGHIFEHILEHCFKRMMEAVTQYTVLLGIFLGCLHLIGQFGEQRSVSFLIPLAQFDQVRFQAVDRITERP